MVPCILVQCSEKLARSLIYKETLHYLIKLFSPEKTDQVKQAQKNHLIVKVKRT